MSTLFAWDRATIAATTDGFELEVNHRMTRRAARYFEDALVNWRDKHDYDVTVGVRPAHEELGSRFSGLLSIDGPGLLQIPALKLREAAEALAQPAQERGEREDEEEREQMMRWMSSLQDDTFDR